MRERTEKYRIGDQCASDEEVTYVFVALYEVIGDSGSFGVVQK